MLYCVLCPQSAPVNVRMDPTKSFVNLKPLIGSKFPRTMQLQILRANEFKAYITIWIIYGNLALKKSKSKSIEVIEENSREYVP